MRRQDLERNGAVQLGVVRLVDDTHTAAAQALDDEVTVDLGTGDHYLLVGRLLARHVARTAFGEVGNDDGAWEFIGLVGFGGHERFVSGYPATLTIYR